MSGIFISYRRQDSAGFTRTLGKKLAERYGADSIFRDLEDIEAGDDFVEAIEEAVSSCQVLLAIIGPHWSMMKNDQGVRRLDNPNDFVRLEIETALKRGIPVIPVTVNGAAWPPAEALPVSMQKLLRYQAHDLSDKQGRWDYDVDQLQKRLDKIDDIEPVKSLDQTQARKSTFNAKLFLGLGTLIIAVLALSNFIPDQDTSTGVNPAQEETDLVETPKQEVIVREAIVKPDNKIDHDHDKQQKEEPVREESEPSGSTVVSQEKNNEPVAEKTVPRQQKINTVDRTSKEYYTGEKLIDISGNWRDRWGVMHYVEMTDNNHFIATSEGVVAEGVINGKQIEFVTSDGGFGKYRLSNLGNHISGTFYAYEGAEGEEVVLMRVK